MNKKSALLMISCALMGFQFAFGQTLTANRIFGDGPQMQHISEGTTKGTLVLLPTIPITFNSLEKDTLGTWHMGTAITGGVGVTLILGKATLKDSKSRVNINPYVMVGGGINAGIKETIGGEVAEAVNISGFVGFGSVAVSFAKGLLTGGNTVGLSLKVDTLTDLKPSAHICFWGCVE